MNTILIQNGGVAEAIVTTSLAKRLLSEGHRVRVIADRDSGQVFDAVEGLRVDFLPSDLGGNFDLAVNLNPDPYGGALMNYIHADRKAGYGFDGEHIVFLDRTADIHYRAARLGLPANANIFQLVFGMAGLCWRGDWYGCRYHPRNRQQASLTGVCIRDRDLREYVMKNLRVKGNLRPLPFRRNSLKQMDEINKCKRLVTDDAGCMHAALALRKQVEYIVRRQPAVRTELFGMGHVHVFNIQAEMENQ